MFRLVLAVPACCIFAVSALAQQSGLINPLGFIAYYESTYDPTTQSSSTSASGLFQDVTATWTQALTACGATCGTISQYPTAASAPPSVQIAANAALINTQGLSAWLCNGCNSQFASLVAQAGGASAFATSGLSTNPNDYLGANANPSAYLAANSFVPGTVAQANGLLPPTAGGGNGITVTAANGNDSIGSAAAAAGVTGAASNSFNPFSWTYTNYQISVSTPVSNQITSVLNMVAPFLLSLLTLTMMVLGVAGFFGRFPADMIFYRLIRIAFVVPLVTLGSGWYQNYVVGMFDSLPLLLSQYILGNTSNNPAAGFDSVIHSVWSSAGNALWNIPWGISNLIVDGVLIVVCALIIGATDALMFLVWLVSQLMLQILLVIGPIMILGLLFDRFADWFWRWVNACLGMILLAGVAQLLTSLALTVITAAFNAQIVSNGAPSQAIYNLFGIALLVIVLGAALPAIWITIQFLAAAGGVGAGAAAGVGVAATAGRAVNTTVTTAFRSIL